MKIYFELFNNKQDILSYFDINETQLNNCDIMFAYYNTEGYEGNAFVLLHDPETNFLYEVNGSHCSCYWLEGQWEMEKTTLEALSKRNYPFFNEVVKAHLSKDFLMKNISLDNKKDSLKKIM